MLRPRVLPVVTLRNDGLVKTTRFRDPVYLGDPVNALRIFDTKEVDELVLLDISATRERTRLDTDRLVELAGECFMPVCYGGGVASVATAEAVLRSGFEKVAVNTALLDRPELADELARELGSQAVVASIDVKRGRLGGWRVARVGTRIEATRRTPVDWSRELEDRGIGEILLTSIDRDGTAEGYDLDLVAAVAAEVGVPVVACGGAGSRDDLRAGLGAGAAAVAAGRMFVTHGKHRASLVSYLAPEEIEALAPAGTRSGVGGPAA